MAAKMVMMLLLGVASAGYQGGGDQTYDTEDEHLSHGGPGGNGHAVGEAKDTDDEQAGSRGGHSVPSASYQGGGDQTYETDDEHLGHGGPGGSGPAVGGFTSGKARRP